MIQRRAVFHIYQNAALAGRLPAGAGLDEDDFRFLSASVKAACGPNQAFANHPCVPLACCRVLRLHSPTRTLHTRAQPPKRPSRTSAVVPQAPLRPAASVRGLGPA